MLSDLIGDELNNLSKEQLIKIIDDWHSVIFRIGEVCVDVDKCHISPDNAVDKIRNYLGICTKYPLYNKNLPDYIDFQLGKISGEEYRNKVLGE